MTRTSGPEQPDGAGKTKSVWGRVLLIPSASATVYVAWLATGWLVPGAAEKDRLCAGALVALVVTVLSVIREAARCGRVAIRQREETKREQIPYQAQRDLIEIRKEQSEAITRLRDKVPAEKMPGLNFEADLDAIIKAGPKPACSQISGKSKTCNRIATNKLCKHHKSLQIPPA